MYQRVYYVSSVAPPARVKFLVVDFAFSLPLLFPTFMPFFSHEFLLTRPTSTREVVWLTSEPSGLETKNPHTLFAHPSRNRKKLLPIPSILLIFKLQDTFQKDCYSNRLRIAVAIDRHLHYQNSTVTVIFFEIKSVKVSI